jgi:FG-GAP-like repeat
VLDVSGERIGLFAGLGDGNFAPAAYIDMPAIPRSVAVADIDGDGALDLVVGYDEVLSFYAGDGHGAFALKGSFHGPALGNLDGPMSPHRVVAADVDNDGHLDVLAASFGSYFAYVYLGDTLLHTSFE